jgi:phage baseplate assembly protein V
VATIASVDLATGRAVVTIDDGVVSPPLRWAASRLGSTRVWSPPSVGEQVMVLCPGGEIGAGVIVGGLDSQAHPHAGNSATELVHFADGAILSYDPTSHALTFALPAGATMAVTASGGVTIDGDVTVTGTLTASVDVLGGGKSLKGHTHTGVQPGSGNSGPPA